MCDSLEQARGCAGIRTAAGRSSGDRLRSDIAVVVCTAFSFLNLNSLCCGCVMITLCSSKIRRPSALFSADCGNSLTIFSPGALKRAFMSHPQLAKPMPEVRCEKCVCTEQLCFPTAVPEYTSDIYIGPAGCNFKIHCLFFLRVRFENNSHMKHWMIFSCVSFVFPLNGFLCSQCGA